MSALTVACAICEGMAKPAPAKEPLPVDAPDPTRLGEVLCLQPYPDALEALPDEAPGPEARYESREAISLAFVTYKYRKGSDVFAL